MASVTAFEAKTRFGQLLERVAAGEEIVITRHDKPVARIVPEGRQSIGQARATVAGLAALRARIAQRSKGGARVTDATVRDAIEHGRL
jgi:prevent-host-death family protein